MDWGYKVKKTFSRAKRCDFADVLSMEWGVQLSIVKSQQSQSVYRRTVKCIVQKGLGIVPVEIYCSHMRIRFSKLDLDRNLFQDSLSNPEYA